MARRGWIAVALAAGLLGAPALAGEESSTRERMRRMQERMSRLEDRLEATTDALSAAEQRVAEQERVMREKGPAQGSGVVSGVADFLQTLELGGWVTASYNYNFNDPDGRTLPGSNSGATGFSHPFHPDSNAFTLDQLWLEVERPVEGEHRAGFRADLLVGKTGEILSGSNGGISGTDEDFHLYQGYVQYRAPIGEGLHFKFGKFATVIGAEVAQAPYNFNVTRGHVYNLFQPITHTGILAATELGGGFSGSLGFVNGTRAANDIELNDDKAALWSLAFERDVFSASFNGTFGSSEESQAGVGAAPARGGLPAGEKELILDVILGLDPTERLSTYANATYLDSENNMDLNGDGLADGDTEGWGVAWAGRLGITERLGAALRAEYATLEADGGARMVGASPVTDPELDVWGLTATVDYALTDRLTVKTELRWDEVEDGEFLMVSGEDAFLENDAAFVGGSPVPSEDDQLVGLVEVTYGF